MKQALKTFVLFVMSWINKFYPKSKRHILFLSYPDMTDNSFSLFKHMLEYGYKGYHFTWLLQDAKSIKLYKKMIKNSISIEEDEIEKIRFFKKNSLLGFFAYCKSRYIFFTHDFFIGMTMPKNQIRVNLWHGMPLKTIAHLDETKTGDAVAKCTYVIATSGLFRKLMSKAFYLPLDQVLLCGQPRCDLLFEKEDHSLCTLGIEKENFSKILFWAPTYRRAFDTDEISDGLFSDGLPVVNLEQLSDLNKHIKSMKSYLLIKLHPMDILNLRQFPIYSNIYIFKNDSLLEKGLQLYPLLSQVDILLTDFSSIYIDFLLTLKPIVFIAEDTLSYGDTRGFTLDKPLEYMPGEFISDYDTLVQVLYDIIINNNDKYSNKRIEINNKFNEIKCNFSEILLDELQIRKI